METFTLTKVQYKRIILEIEGNVNNPNCKIDKIYFRNYLTNKKVVPQHVYFDDTSFSISMNVLSVNKEYPIAIGEWYLIIESKNKHLHQCFPEKELLDQVYLAMHNEKSDSYNVRFIRNINTNFFKAESYIDEDNGAYYLKVDSMMPLPPLSWWEKKKKEFNKNFSIYRRRKFVQFFDFCKRFNKKDGNKMLFTSDSRSEISGNAQFVYNRIVERGLDKNYKIVFSYKGNLNDHRSLRQKFKFAYQLATANIIFTDDYQPELYYVDFLPGVEIIQLWHACGAFKTIGLERIDKPGATTFDTKVHKCYTAVTVSSDHSGYHTAESFGISESKIFPLGVARTDIFFDEKYKEYATNELYDTYPSLKDASQVILYAPTFRGINAKYASFPMYMIDFEKIGEYLIETNSIMIIKLHPFIKNKMKIPKKYKDVFINATAFREINDILFVTDLLITDYSSVIYEFSLLNKPMLFFAFDYMKYEQDRGFYEPYIDTVPGKIVRTTDELVRALKNKDYGFDKMDDFLKKNFKFRDGKSTDRIIDCLVLGKDRDKNCLSYKEEK